MIMTKKERICIAKMLLTECSGHVSQKNPGDLAFDFVVGNDNEDIEVFRADANNDTFFWPEDVVEIVKGLGLSCYISRTDAPFGQDKYGNDIKKNVLCIRIY